MRSPQTAPTPPVASATAELLAWIRTRPRTYDEAVEVWRTSCPRHSVWEDAIADGLVEVSRRGGLATRSTVALSARGRAVLAGLDGRGPDRAR